MEWILIVGFVTFTIIIVLIIFLLPKKKKTMDLDDINACINACEAQFLACQQACSNLGSECTDGEQLACSINDSLCNRDCYPAIYAIRNGSVYDLSLIHISSPRD